MSNVRARLEAVVSEYNLLDHPFYQAWSAGQLPVKALASYAAEWGNFVALVPKGWSAHGEDEIAAEEVTHVALWDDFAASLGTRVGPPLVGSVQALQEVCEVNFGDPVASVGALYAFEAQQPHTSASKLDGLRKWYEVGEKGEEYFRIHCDDIHEMEVLAQRAESFTAGEQDQTVEACRETAKALWDGLTGIHNLHCSAMEA